MCRCVPPNGIAGVRTQPPSGTRKGISPFGHGPSGLLVQRRSLGSWLVMRAGLYEFLSSVCPRHTRRQGDLGPEHMLGLGRSVARLGTSGVSCLYSPFMLCKRIGHGCVRDLWRVEEENGAHGDLVMLRSPPQAQVASTQGSIL